MSRVLQVVVPQANLRAELTEENPETAAGIRARLPLEGEALRWGQEVYFYVDLVLPAESPREVLEVGEIGYWPSGQAVALFFGATPASRAGEPRAASGVNVFARITDDPSVLDRVVEGDPVALRAAD